MYYRLFFLEKIIFNLLKFKKNKIIYFFAGFLYLKIENQCFGSDRF
jgi:hypothetical protein